MSDNKVEIHVFPGRLLVERELMPQVGMIIDPKGRQRRRNKGKVVKSSDPEFSVGDDVFFLSRRGTIIGDNALIDTNDVILINMKLKGERVAVAPAEEKKVTEGGIIVPDTIRVEPQIGTVKAIGDKVPEGEYNEGDVILFRKDSGIVYDKDNVRTIILNTKDILAVL